LYLPFAENGKKVNLIQYNNKSIRLFTIHFVVAAVYSLFMAFCAASVVVRNSANFY